MKDLDILLKLIHLLSDGRFYSSKNFSNIFKISTLAVSNHIQILREWGIDILTVPDKGYRLYEPLQLLDESIINTLLPSGRIIVLSAISSTNQYLIERIGSLKSGDACVAEYQAHGRGRRGRSWVSTFGNNLYLSLYWRLEHGLIAANSLSLAVGIVVAEVLHRLGVEEGRVKWPNDLYLKDRKLAGILIEITGKTGNDAHVIIGAGINLTMHDSAAKAINQSWINLKEAGISINRNLLVAELTAALRQALHQFEDNGFAPFMPRWKALDNFFNRPVKLIIGNREVIGVARGIDSRGALLLEQEAGNSCAYLNGDISLRGV